MNAPVFEGTRNEAELFVKGLVGQHYVYVLSRPDGRPFYIGRGIRRRVFDHEAEARQNHPIGERNPFKCNVIRKILREGGEVRYAIDSVFEADCASACDARETVLIGRHGRLHEGGILTNLAPGTGGLGGRAPFSTERHSATLSGEPEDNPERAVLNRFLKAIGPVDSVPIKPIGQISRIEPTIPHSQKRSPTKRCAYVLIASASASGLRLEPGVVLPRRFVYQGVEAIIENGVSKDMLKAGMIELVPAADPREERFRLSDAQVRTVVHLYGREGLIERGLI